MKWLQEKVVKTNSENIKFVRFTKGLGSNSKNCQLYLCKALYEEAEEKGFMYIRIGVDEIDNKKILGFNMNKSYGGMELKNRNGGYKKVFNISKYIEGYKEEGIELPFNQKLELTKDGQNYIYKL